MMDKVDVNGVEAHPVYHYLKKVAGPVSTHAHVVMSMMRSIFFLIDPRLDQ
jgi:glutathione peroxidase-family protein